MTARGRHAAEGALGDGGGKNLCLTACGDADRGRGGRRWTGKGYALREAPVAGKERITACQRANGSSLVSSRGRVNGGSLSAGFSGGPILKVTIERPDCCSSTVCRSAANTALWLRSRVDRTARQHSCRFAVDGWLPSGRMHGATCSKDAVKLVYQ